MQSSIVQYGTTKAQTVHSSGSSRLGRRELVPGGSIVQIGQTMIGDGKIAVIAGPCAVENRDQMITAARAVADHGAVVLRGGAFKPRTSPYSFQGLQWEGLDLLCEARRDSGLPVITEVVDPRHVERLAMSIDAFQVGARNMHNFALLSELSKTSTPVLLKRGFGATVEEFLAAGEYLLAGGNNQVILCERGIRTFEPSTRFTLDLSAVALLKQRTHLPVVVDPSHAAGVPSLVEPLALAAVCAGADALMIDVHDRPKQALCDGDQALLPDQFGRVMDRLQKLGVGIGRDLTTVTGPSAGSDPAWLRTVS